MTGEHRSVVEELEVAGQDLVRRVRELVQDSNARRLTICAQEGDGLMSMLLSFGLVGASGWLPAGW